MSPINASTQQRPDTLPPVLLHGWGFTPEVWQPLLQILANGTASGATVLTPALPATGQLMDDLDQLAASLPARIHLAGWSLGGEIALAYAQKFPERVASLTLIASTPCFLQKSDWMAAQPASLLDDFSQRLADDPVALLKRFSMLIRHGDPAAARNRVLADTLQAAAEPDATRLKQGLSLLGSLDLRSVMAQRLGVPLQLIHGTADAVVPIDAAMAMQKSSSAILHVLPDASHALPLTHAPALAQHLQCFWRNLS